MAIINWPQDISNAAAQAYKKIENIYEVLRGRQAAGGSTAQSFNKLGYDQVLFQLRTIFSEGLLNADPKGNIGLLNSEKWVMTYGLTPPLMRALGWAIPNDAAVLAFKAMDCLYGSAISQESLGKTIFSKQWQKNLIAQVLFLAGDRRSFDILSDPLNAEQIGIMVYLLDGSELVGSHTIESVDPYKRFDQTPAAYRNPGFRRSILAEYDEKIISFLQQIMPQNIAHSDFENIENMCKILILSEKTLALHYFLGFADRAEHILFQGNPDRNDWKMFYDGASELRNCVVLTSPMEPNLYKALFKERCSVASPQVFYKAMGSKHSIIRWLLLESIIEYGCPEGVDVNEVSAKAANDPAEAVRKKAKELPR